MKLLNRYQTKLFPASILSHSDFSATTSSAYGVLSSGTNSVITGSSLTISTASSIAVSSNTYNNQSISFAIASSSTSDVYYQVSDQSYSVVESYSTAVTPDLSWSSSGSTSISFSLGSYNGANVPSWVSINSSSGTLSISSTIVSSDTSYSFYINAAIGGVSSAAQKVVTVTVKNWAVSNCKTWSSLDANTWIAWDSDYGVSSGSWVLSIYQKF